MKIIRKLHVIFTMFAIIIACLRIGIYIYAWICPKLSINNVKSYYFYDSNNTPISLKEEWIKFDNINDYVIKATLAIEDKNFFKHSGFDYPRILKALTNNIISGKAKEGASTITQQYAKNLYLNFDKTLERKIDEAWLTVRLEMHYTKNDIMEGYLNTINYGGIFGIENASKYYFNKSSNNLTLAEAAMLAGIPNRPSEYSPVINYDAAKKRQLIVLNAMYKQGYITQEQLEDAYSEEIILEKENIDSTMLSVMYYKDAVLNELKTIIPNINTQNGLKVYTYLDLHAQRAIQEGLNINPEIQISCVMMKPEDGSIIGLIGGYDYSQSQYNRAIQANRSVGSTLKPFLYYAALENNFTASTTFTSEKTTFVFADDKTYAPHNYGSIYPNKKISLAYALATSDNIYAVKTHLFLGSDALVETMKRVGVKQKLDSIPSLALGSQPVSLIEMVSAYAVLANEGYKIKPHLIKKIEDMNGNILYEFKSEPEQVLNKSITYIISELLSNSSNPKYIGTTYPTAYVIANKLTKKYAIKTGTTDFDHLVFGYNKDIVLGLWTGYDDNREITNQDAYNGKESWANIIEKYLKDKSDNWYSMPNNVVGVLTDPINGNLANKDTINAVIQYYLKGTEPFDYNLDETIPTIKLE